MATLPKTAGAGAVAAAAELLVAACSAVASIHFDDRPPIAKIYDRAALAHRPRSKH